MESCSLHTIKQMASVCSKINYLKYMEAMPLSYIKQSEVGSKEGKEERRYKVPKEGRKYGRKKERKEGRKEGWKEGGGGEEIETLILKHLKSV